MVRPGGSGLTTKIYGEANFGGEKAAARQDEQVAAYQEGAISDEA